MSISVALGSFGSGYDLIFAAACGSFGSGSRVKKKIIFVSYFANDLMFCVLI